jgi:hypothetical protein
MREPFPGPLPRIRGTQVGLENPAQIDRIKKDMLNGQYAYDEIRGQATGVIDPHGVYHVMTGHHRMVAALEILSDTGQDLYVRLLLSNGSWPKVSFTPHNSRPMPGRVLWSWLRNWIGF